MKNAFYSIAHDVLTEPQRFELVNGVINAPFFGSSVLGQEFVKTEGFSLVFQRSYVNTVIKKFPFLKHVLLTALFDECNAFYVNPLVLYNQSEVEPHIDCRLTKNGLRLIPNLVSVYYADIDPKMEGGRIVLHPGKENEVRFLPKSGDLLHFLGTVIHRVEPVAFGRKRVSIVCEQYNLDMEQLKGFPLCEVLTGENSLVRANAMRN